MSKTEKKLTPAETYNAAFNKEVERRARLAKPFTVDDVIGKVGKPPQGGKALGALMKATAARLGLVQIGVERSLSASRRGAFNRVWKAE